MLKTFRKLVRLNLDDFLLYLGVEGGLFLLIQVLIGCVMYFSGTAESVTVSCVLFPIVGGFTALVAGISHVGISFEQALRFGQTRRRALGLTVGLCALESAFALVLAALLAAVERSLCVPLWARLAELDGWTTVPRSGAGRVLRVETFSLDWYWWLLIFAAAVAGGIVVGAVIQRFGGKGGWIIWGVCMAPVILSQIFPWRSYALAGQLLPILAAVFAAGFLWSIWSLLHAVVRS